MLRIALDMCADSVGRSLDDIRRYADPPLSRRTAERLRDAIERTFPGFEQANPDEVPKRWRIRGMAPIRLAQVGAGDLADLDAAAALLRQAGREDQAARVGDLGRKIKASLPPAASRRIDPDLEALIEADGLAMRPGPRERIDAEIVRRLRDAILARRKVRFDYVSRGEGRRSQPTVCPYGLLHGTRHYLVAAVGDPADRDHRLFTLANIANVDLLQQAFAHESFDLAAFAAQSFGVYRDGEPVDVVWRFSEDAAADARQFRFHPTQTIEDLPDGRLIVRFRATGLREMCWHLFTWGEHVEVLAPPELRRRFREMALAAAGGQGYSAKAGAPYDLVTDLCGRLDAEIREARLGDDGIWRPPSYWSALPLDEWLERMAVDVIEGDRQPDDVFIVLGTCRLMQSPSIVTLYEVPIRSFFWSLVARLGEDGYRLDRSDLGAVARIVVREVWYHEAFHAFSDMARTVLGITLDRHREEALAVACARLRLDDDASDASSPIAALAPALRNAVFDAAFRYTAPGYRDWPHAYPQDRFVDALARHLLLPPAAALGTHGAVRTAQDLAALALGWDRGFVARIA